MSFCVTGLCTGMAMVATRLSAGAVAKMRLHGLPIGDEFDLMREPSRQWTHEASDGTAEWEKQKMYLQALEVTRRSPLPLVVTMPLLLPVPDGSPAGLTGAIAHGFRWQRRGPSPIERGLVLMGWPSAQLDWRKVPRVQEFWIVPFFFGSRESYCTFPMIYM